MIFSKANHRYGSFLIPRRNSYSLNFTKNKKKRRKNNKNTTNNQPKKKNVKKRRRGKRRTNGNMSKQIAKRKQKKKRKRDEGKKSVRHRNGAEAIGKEKKERARKYCIADFITPTNEKKKYKYRNKKKTDGKMLNAKKLLKICVYGKMNIHSNYKRFITFFLNKKKIKNEMFFVTVTSYSSILYRKMK